jgi:hypothetical protein
MPPQTAGNEADGFSLSSSRLLNSSNPTFCKQQQQEEEQGGQDRHQGYTWTRTMGGAVSPLLGDGELHMTGHSTATPAAAALLGAELRVHCCTFNMADTLPGEFPRELLHPPQSVAVAASRKGSMETTSSGEIQTASEGASTPKQEQLLGDGQIDMYVIATQVRPGTYTTQQTGLGACYG